MTTLANGNKTATITETTDGYGDKAFRVRLTQDYFDGVRNAVRFIGSKDFEKQASANRYANKKLKIKQT